VPAPSSVHVSGSSRKAAYIIEWATSATKAAATAARSGTRRAPRNRRASAAASSARYATSPITPCSAATVTGIVCEAEAARSGETCSARRYSRANEPEPWPTSGSRLNSFRPPLMRS
jgi:hypothetical protein